MALLLWARAHLWTAVWSDGGEVAAPGFPGQAWKGRSAPEWQVDLTEALQVWAPGFGAGAAGGAVDWHWRAGCRIGREEGEGLAAGAGAEAEAEAENVAGPV